MPPTKVEAGPHLSIAIDDIGRPYQAGDIITGRVIRKTHVVCPMTIVEVWLLGRAKVRLGVTTATGTGAQTTYYRGRFNFFEKNPKQIQAGPVHIPQGGAPESWEFALEIPTTMSPTAVLSEHKHPDRGSFVPLDSSTITSQTLPASFFARGHRGDKDFETYVEYHIEASMVLQGSHGKSISASQPIVMRAPAMPYPLASYDLQPQFQISSVSTWRLVPGMEDVHLSLKQKTQKLFHSSKVPSLGFRLFMSTPTAIQLGHPAPVPVKVRVEPDRRHSTDILHDAPQFAVVTSLELVLKAKTFVLANGYKKKVYETDDVLRHRIHLPCNSVVTSLGVQPDGQNPPEYEEQGKDTSYPQDVKVRLPTPPQDEEELEEGPSSKAIEAGAGSALASVSSNGGESSASGSELKRIITPRGPKLPINWNSEAPISNTEVDIGSMMDLHIYPNRVKMLGNRTTETEKSGIYPGFTSYCMRHEHALKWKMTLNIAGENINFEGEQPLTVLAASAE